MKENNSTFLKTESWKTKLFRIGMNLFPSYRRGGGRVAFISSDWYEIHVRLSLNWLTRNYVGSVFGGSIYAALDPVYMLQFIKILGNNYIVWDKSATISFKRPIKKVVYAKFILNDMILDYVRNEINKFDKTVIDLKVNFQDSEGVVYAEVSKQIYIADKNYYKSRMKTINK